MRRLASVLIAILAACGAEAPPPEDPGPDATVFTHVLAAETTYYTGSPAQARPPDGTFPAGTKVRIAAEGGSYTRVETEAGVDAWVATDSLEKIE